MYLQRVSSIILLIGLITYILCATREHIYCKHIQITSHSKAMADFLPTYVNKYKVNWYKRNISLSVISTDGSALKTHHFYTPYTFSRHIQHLLY